MNDFGLENLNWVMGISIRGEFESIFDEFFGNLKRREMGKAHVTEQWCLNLNP